MSDRIVAALQRTEERLLELSTIESLLLRIRRGDATDYDCQHVIEEIFSFQRADGSWHGSLVRTAETLLLLHELGAARSTKINSAVAWIYKRQNADGRFGEECTRALHAVHLCPHFVTGFFSPAPRQQNLDSLHFSCGCAAGDDRDARIAVSALACTALLEWGEANFLLGVHIEAAARMVRLTTTSNFRVSVSSFCVLLRCLLASPASVRQEPVIESGYTYLSRLQRADGSWPGADLFFVLETLAAGREAGRAGSQDVTRAMLRAADLLVLLQQLNGDWSHHVNPWRCLVAGRILRITSGHSPALLPVLSDAPRVVRTPHV